MLGYQRRLLWIVACINLMILPSAQVTVAESTDDSAGDVSAHVKSKAMGPLETEFVITGGYRADNLDFNIAGDINGNNPNIISELTWDDLESYQLKFQGSLVWPDIIALRGSVNYGWIYDGKNQDSDY